MKAQTLINQEVRGIAARLDDRELLDDDAEKAKWDRYLAVVLLDAQSVDLSDDGLIDQLATKVIEKLYERGDLPLPSWIPAMDNMPEFMIPDEVQDVLRISRATFFRLASKGEIPGVVKIGKALRIDRDQLKAYMKKTVADG